MLHDRVQKSRGREGLCFWWHKVYAENRDTCPKWHFSLPAASLLRSLWTSWHQIAHSYGPHLRILPKLAFLFHFFHFSAQYCLYLAAQCKAPVLSKDVPWSSWQLGSGRTGLLVRCAGLASLCGTGLAWRFLGGLPQLGHSPHACFNLLMFPYAFKVRGTTLLDCYYYCNITSTEQCKICGQSNTVVLQ